MVILTSKREAYMKNKYSIFASSIVGASHIKNKKPCQDASIFDEGKDYRFIAVADGHGGDLYFRSNLGSQFALEALRSCILDNMVIKSLCKNINNKDREHMILQLKKSIITRWNILIEKDMEKNPFTEKELIEISQKDADEYRNGKCIENAYGTTLITVLWTKEFLLALHIGDGTCVLLNNEVNFKQPIPKDEKCYMNVTTSLCDINAIDSFHHFYTKNLPIAALISTDGIDDCFAETEKLYDFYRIILTSFIYKDMKDAKNELIDYLPRLSEKGSGDDISIGIIINNEIIRKMNLETDYTKKEC